ncbi:MAG: DUF1295 domain-containing protein, partial [Pseudomonadota bacterium]
MTDTETESDRSNGQIIIAIAIALGLGGLIGWAGSQGSTVAYGWPVFAICAALAYAINWLVFIPSAMGQTEKFYDLTGGVSYISVIVVAVLLTPNIDLRGKIAAACVIVWSGRLATFLFRRISKDGKDGRFDTIKTRPL